MENLEKITQESAFDRITDKLIVDYRWGLLPAVLLPLALPVALWFAGSAYANAIMEKFKLDHQKTIASSATYVSNPSDNPQKP